MGRNYFIVDCPAYNRSSNKQRFRVVRINGNDNPVVEEYKIIKNVVFRDGGTTIMTVVGEDGVEHEFFSPTPIDQDKFPTWDKYVLQKVLIEEKEEIVKILGLVLEPEEPEIKED
jgi:Na+-transporting NADH:ubiquinone oxidoreductase subunit NqrF